MAYENDKRAIGKFNTYLGNIAITQYNDDGKELWGCVLPKMSCYQGVSGFYNPVLFTQKNQSQEMFGDLPEQVYNRQFFATNTYCRNRCFYMLFNDHNSNLNSTLKNVGETFYGPDKTNTFYYKINRKKEISKSYVFGTPAADEYISSFTEGADFVEQNGMYAALVSYKKGDNISLRMAWSLLD